MSGDQTDDYRSPAEHDYDRLLYSSAYRRLTGVTQVVAVGERQLLHNRLTHTQKVAQLSRRIAQFLQRRYEADVDVDSAEAAGLAHDLGHPPFGHIAERVLDECCTASDVDGFEGNAQSFRIVTKLAVRREQLSLDLSARTLDGILKYPWMSDHPNARKKDKWGAYLSERDDFQRVRTDPDDTSQSLEAAIMDWADDISYAVHDLEDFYRAGFIRLGSLFRDEVARTEFLAKALKEWGGENWSAEATEVFDFISRFVLIEADFDGTERSRSEVNRMGSALIGRYVLGTELNATGGLEISEDLRKEVHLLKQLTWQFVINDPPLATLQRGQERVVRDLFEALTEWTTQERRQQRLPTRLRDLLERASKEEHVSDRAVRARATADYISSLTEDQALDLHSRLHGYSRGSIQDTWVAY